MAALFSLHRGLASWMIQPMEKFDFGNAPPAPLAELLRPKTLDEVVGQDGLLGPNGYLRLMLAQGT